MIPFSCNVSKIFSRICVNSRRNIHNAFSVSNQVCISARAPVIFERSSGFEFKINVLKFHSIPGLHLKQVLLEAERRNIHTTGLEINCKIMSAQGKCSDQKNGSKVADDDKSKEVMEQDTEKNKQTLSYKRCLTLPPTSVKGMTSLNKCAFDKTIKVKCITISAKYCRDILKTVGHLLLNVKKMKFICDIGVESGEPSKQLIFDPDKIHSVTNFTALQTNALLNHNVDLNTFHEEEIKLGYNNWSAQEILRAVIPDDLVSVTAFTIVGHIAHVNLSPDLNDYKTLIGQVIMDKNSTIKTVVNKLNEIDNTYRNFQMELLGGDDNFITTVKQSRCIYRFDFSKVFWNTRLGNEHDRIVKTVAENDYLFDVFAGVGPFAIPASKKGINVFANDLNPHSFESLQENIKLNKIKNNKLKCFNMDGREFISTVVRDVIYQLWKVKQTSHKMHVAMNLPALAIDFLDAFKGLFYEDRLEMSQNFPDCLYPIVHCHCFSKSEDWKTDVRERTELVLGESLSNDHSVTYVRNVAPSKEMLCISFKLTPSMLFGKPVIKKLQNDNEGGEPETKKRKTDESEVSLKENR